ncbi:MAG: DUF427 domain-containing protein [Chloroflexaceae bacterium]|nr:DUF427 domain-containing protein [Chloroflexaceae bacterium]NJL33065.1 DUF427 domain-containing protein [Chloroflexaceae bacterium]NJO04926.1 DUF427 domain-containing protein [Chloroflexaceae bacterium]
MARAVVNGVVLAESDAGHVVEGNYYFPPESVNWDYFTENSRHTTCPWKGQASYYDIVVNGETLSAKAWYYPEPKDAAKQIKGHVAFYQPPVTVEQ